MSCTPSLQCICAAWLICIAASSLGAQDNPKPELKLVSPLIAVKGTTTRVVLRGARLDQATEVRGAGLDAVNGKITIASKAMSAAPNGLSAEKVGDTEVQIDLELTAECTVAEVPLLAVTPEGETTPLSIRVVNADAITLEQEPNDGYKASQEITPDKLLCGTVHEPKNVDVFRIHLTAGQTLIVKIESNQLHSPLDPLLMLSDTSGRILTMQDDDSSNADPVLRWQATVDGDYLVCLFDANDKGSAWHHYLMQAHIE